MALPIFASAALATDGVTLTVTYTDATGTFMLPASAATGYTVFENGNPLVISTAIGSAVALTNTLVLSAPVVAAQVVTVAYTPGNVTDNNANILAAYTAQPVTNGSTVAASATLVAPVLAVTAGVKSIAGTLSNLTVGASYKVFYQPQTSLLWYETTVSNTAALFTLIDFPSRHISRRRARIAKISPLISTIRSVRAIV